MALEIVGELIVMACNVSPNSNGSRGWVKLGRAYSGPNGNYIKPELDLLTYWRTMKGTDKLTPLGKLFDDPDIIGSTVTEVVYNFTSRAKEVNGQNQWFNNHTLVSCRRYAERDGHQGNDAAKPHSKSTVGDESALDKILNSTTNEELNSDEQTAE